MTRFVTHGFLSVFAALTLMFSAGSVAHADQRDFTLYNETGQVIVQVFVSPSNVVDWGDDILGRDILDDEDSVFIYFKRFEPGSCLYDIKVVTKSGDEGVLTQVNLCEVDTVTFN